MYGPYIKLEKFIVNLASKYDTFHEFVGRTDSAVSDETLEFLILMLFTPAELQHLGGIEAAATRVWKKLAENHGIGEIPD